MNTSHTFQVRTAVVAATCAVVATIGSPAFAEHSRFDDGPRAHMVSPFAVPIAALGGRTLAQYVEQHHAGDRHVVTWG
jgi:hypothetical protein